MTYTEIKKRNGNKYYYRVISLREKNKVSKMRVYLGVNLSIKDLEEKIKESDKKLNLLSRLKAFEKIKLKIIRILKKNKIKKAGIFGSYARGEQKKNSDIDILVEPSKGMGFKFAGLEIQLAKALNKKVDLVSYNGISPYLKDRILNQEIKII